MRHAYIPNVPQYQMQATTAPFQPAQFIPQQPQYFNQGMPQAMYYMQPNQQIQQPQQQQQQPTQTQTQNTAIQTNNINKPKQKRSSKIVIRDPSKDNKDVTEEILHSNTANGRTGSTPPLTNSSVQTDSSKIQAQFAAQVAARVGGEKGKQINEKKAEDTGKDKDGQASTAQIDETKREENIQGNGSIVKKETYAKDLPQNNTEIPNKVTSIAEENRTGSPKGTTDNTHANQSSPTLGEMTQKMKMTIESQKETRNETPKVVLKRADRETTTKSEGSETKEVADISVPVSENSENTVERKTSKVVVHSPVEPTKNEDKGNSLDNGQNSIVSNTPKSNETLSELTSDKTEDILETVTDTEGDAKEDIGKETGSKQEDIAQIQEEIIKPNESHRELLSQPEVTKQETSEQQAEEAVKHEQNKLSQAEKQPELTQADKEQQIRQAEKEQEFEETKQQEQQIDKQQQQQSDKQEEKQSDKQQQQSDKQQEKQSDKQQQQSDKQEEKQSDKQQEKQSDKQQQQSDKHQEKPSDKQQQQSDKQQQQQQARQPDKKQDNPKPQQQEKQLQQSQKTGEKYL